MKNFESMGIRYLDGKLEVIDQQQLPHKEIWVDCSTPEIMADAIYHLKTRGAPLIGVSAALSLGKYVEEGASEEEFKKAAELLRDSRPTAVNLMNCIDRLLAVSPFSSEAVVCEAEKIAVEDVELCESIAKNGAQFISDGDNVLTHCNTGGLATAGIGTALGVIVEAHRQGKKIHVFVDETRPLLQGGRLTTYELEKHGIPYTLICDNMAASLMAMGKIQLAIVGSDRIAVNGDFANKIGTYGVAVNCHYHKVPFYVAAPYTTVDLECNSGDEIPIEERKPFEVRGVSGSFGDVQWAPSGGEVYNPAFDVTPNELVTGWILDNGAFDKNDVKNGCLKG